MLRAVCWKRKMRLHIYRKRKVNAVMVKEVALRGSLIDPVEFVRCYVGRSTE